MFGDNGGGVNVRFVRFCFFESRTGFWYKTDKTDKTDKADRTNTNQK